MTKVLSFDPSGNFSEGKGTTGWAVFKQKDLSHFGEIKASDYMLKQEYFSAHQDLIEETMPNVIVIESYKLFGHKAKQQSGSSLETPQLIGFIEMVAFQHNIPVVFQDPSSKVRVADDILTRMGVFEKKGRSYYCQGHKTSLHERDSIRHGIFYIRYKLKEEVK